MDCAYELGQHKDIAQAVGLSSVSIAALTSESGWQNGDFDPTELAVLRLTTELVTTRRVAAELSAKCTKLSARRPPWRR